jgi:hypothetical protein
MQSSALAATCSLTALLLAGASGCSGLEDCNKLAGAVALTYDLSFSAVTIEKQIKSEQFQAMRVTYLNGATNDIPVRVVANAPIEAGQHKDLAKAQEASVYRVMANNSDFPEVREGYIVFDDLGDVGDDGNGKFYATFLDGTTLNGEFCGVVKELKN